MQPYAEVPLHDQFARLTNVTMQQYENVLQHDKGPTFDAETNRLRAADTLSHKNMMEHDRLNRRKPSQRPEWNVLFSVLSIQRGVKKSRYHGGLNSDHIRHVLRAVDLPDDGNTQELRDRLGKNLERCMWPWLPPWGRPAIIPDAVTPLISAEHKALDKANALMAAHFDDVD